MTYDLNTDAGKVRLLISDTNTSAHVFTDADLHEMVEYLLRIIQSFVIDPGRPPRRGTELRDYLRRWVGGASRSAPAWRASS